MDLESIYIDGTKIEANANRYTFVWKKFILKHQEKLIQKILDHFKVNEDLSSEDCKKLVLIELNNIRNICKSNDIVFNYGKGKRKPKEQKEYEIVEEWLNKLYKFNGPMIIIRNFS